MDKLTQREWSRIGVSHSLLIYVIVRNYEFNSIQFTRSQNKFTWWHLDHIIRLIILVYQNNPFNRRMENKTSFFLYNIRLYKSSTSLYIVFLQVSVNDGSPQLLVFSTSQPLLFCQPFIQASSVGISLLFTVFLAFKLTCEC